MRSSSLLENTSLAPVEKNFYTETFTPAVDLAAGQLSEIGSAEQRDRLDLGRHAMVSFEASLYGTEGLKSESAETIRLPVTKIEASSKSEKEMSDDNYLVGENFAAICDGVGSSEHGGIASTLAVNFLAEHLPTVNQLTSRKAAAKSVRKILKKTHRLACDEQEATGLSMASTATTLNYIVIGNQTYAVIGNVGDSPAYLTRNGKLREITDWHSKKMPKPAKRPALGKKMSIAPEVYVLPVSPDDTITLTSNGVRKRDQNLKKVRKIAKKNFSPSDAAQSLTELTGPSHDDITAVVSRFVGATLETNAPARDSYTFAA